MDGSLHNPTAVSLRFQGEETGSYEMVLTERGDCTVFFTEDCLRQFVSAVEELYLTSNRDSTKRRTVALHADDA